MRDYEVALIVRPDLDDSAFNDLVEKLKSWITEAGGQVAKVDSWGKRKLAYSIRKQTDGYYVFVKTHMEPVFCAQLERNLRIQEPVMRFLITEEE